MPVATLESVSFSYGRNRVLNDIDLNLDNRGHRDSWAKWCRQDHNVTAIDT